MTRWAMVGRIIAVTVIAIGFSTVASAQFNASIQGTVTDKSGAVVSNATVTVTNQANGVTGSATTNNDGRYSIQHLPPGAYTVAVEAPSFKKVESRDVLVEAETPRGFNATLEPGQVSQNVEVSAAAEGLETETANQQGTITTTEVLELPQVGRDPYNLIRLTPGVFGDAGRDASGNSRNLPQQTGPGGSNTQIFQVENQVQVTANGQRVSANDIMLDGVSVNSLDWGGAAVLTPNQESVQEITVVSASYSAEDGRNSGAQVKTVSKGGTNNLHGSGVFHMNDKGLNAFNRFEGPTTGTHSTITCEGGTPSQFMITAAECPERVDQKYRQFAGSLGGPIIKNKLFVFFSYEGVRSNSSSLVRSVPLDAPSFDAYVIKTNPNSIAAKIFSTPGYAARIVSTQDQVDCCSLDARALGTWYQPGTAVGQAVGGGPDGIFDWGIYDVRVPNSISGDQFNGRLDLNQGKNQFFFSSYYTQGDFVNGGQRPIDDITQAPTNYIFTIGWTRTLTNSLLNDLRGNFTRYAYNQLTPSGNTDYGIPQIRLFDFDISGKGSVTGKTIGFGSNDGFIGIGQSGTTPGNLAQNTFSVRDTLSWVHGNHVFKFGGEAIKEQNNNNESGAYRPQYQFRGLLNFANDACCFYEQQAINPTTGGVPSGLRHFRTGDYAVFVDDQWKFRPNLTLTLGLRWEYFSPLTETNDLMTNYVPGSNGYLNGTVVPVKQLYKPDRNNFGPKLGFAWMPWASDSSFVVRGGFGVSYNRNFGVVFSNIRQNTPFQALASACCFFDPGMIQGPPPGSNISYGIGSSTSAFSFAPNPAFAFGVAPDGALCGNAACTSVTKVDLYGALAHEPNPYVFSYELEIQKELTHHDVLKLGYYGSRTRKLIRTIDIQRINPGDTFDGNQDCMESTTATGTALATPIQTCNPRFGRIFIPLPDVNASYDSMVANYTHRFSQGLQMTATYTWAHTIDTASYEIGYQQTDPSNQALQKANSDYDVRNNFTLGAVYQLPIFRKQNNFMGKVLGGWTVSPIFDKHSGFPWSPVIGSCNTSNDRNGDSYCPDAPYAFFGGMIVNPTKSQWVNGVFPTPATSFDVATRGPGCRCRNILPGPGFSQVDLSLEKHFGLPNMKFIGEGAGINLRANAFNVFNILNFVPFLPATAPTDIANTGQFGKAQNALAGRVVEFEIRANF